MTITRQASSSIVTNGGAGITVPMPANASVGWIIVISLYHASNDVPTVASGPTLSPGASVLSDFGSDRANTYTRICDGSETTSDTWSFTGNFTNWWGVVDVYSATGTLSVVTNGSGAQGTTLTSSSITTAAGDSLFVAAGARSNISSFAAPLTAIAGTGTTFAIADANPSAGSATYSVTLASFNEGAFTWAILSESGGGGGAANNVDRPLMRGVMRGAR